MTREQLLEQVSATQDALDDARQAAANAIFVAEEQGCSLRDIAGAAGYSRQHIELVLQGHRLGGKVDTAGP